MRHHFHSWLFPVFRKLINNYIVLLLLHTRYVNISWILNQFGSIQKTMWIERDNRDTKREAEIHNSKRVEEKEQLED